MLRTISLSETTQDFGEDADQSINWEMSEKNMFLNSSQPSIDLRTDVFDRNMKIQIKFKTELYPFFQTTDLFGVEKPHT